MPYNFTLTTLIPASPQEIYEAWLDSVTHSEMTGNEASMSDEIGAEVSAHDGYISGSNLELVPGERIVQAWRTTEFGDEHLDFVITVTDADGGALGSRSHFQARCRNACGIGLRSNALLASHALAPSSSSRNWASPPASRAIAFPSR